MKIAALRAVSSSSPFRYTQLALMADELGFTIRYPEFGNESTLEDVTRGYNMAKELISSADAFIVNSTMLSDYPELKGLFHERIDAGARAFVEPHSHSEQSRAANKDLLGRYYMEPINTRMVGPNGERLGVAFRRAEGSFRSPELFTGVETLVVDQPNALRVWGEAWPVVVGSEEHWAVGGATDLPEDWNGRELIPLAVWYGHSGGAVIVSHGGGILTDPADVLARRLPGIENNRVLAKNILRFLRHSQRREPEPAPKNLLDRIETNLVDVVLRTIKRELGVDWWVDGVPEDIRQKCASRQEEERNKLHRECYLDLIDLKKIMSKNWKLFESLFVAANSGKQGKDNNLSFMDELNRLRRLVGHPLKAHLSDYQFSDREIATIREADELALKLSKMGL